MYTFLRYIIIQKKPMKFFITLLTCLVYCHIVSAQSKTITVLDGTTLNPIEGVKVETGESKAVNTDAKGQFQATVKDLVTLSYIGYTSLTFAADTVTKPVLLQPEDYELKGITIQSKNLKKKTITALPKEGLRSLVPKNYGTSAPLGFDEAIAVYIPATHLKPGAMVTKISFQPTDYLTIEKGKYIKHPGARYAPFRANVYYANAKTHQPLTPVFKEDFELKLAEGEKYALIILDESQRFAFPEEGLCIVVRCLPEDVYKESGFRSAPAFDKLDVGKDNKFWQFRKALYLGDEAEWKTEFIFATRNEIYRFDLEVEYYD